MPPVPGYATVIDAVHTERIMRHFPQNPLPQNSVRDAKFEELAQALQAKSFKCFSAQDFQAAVEKKGYPNKVAFAFLDQGEYLFSRSADSSDSNFFVFVKKTKNGLVISYTNPASGQEALKLQTADVYVRRVMSNDPADSNVPTIVGEILAYAALKPKDEYRGQFHNHSGYIFEHMTGQMARLNDDGQSDILDFMRAALYHHLDVCLWTSHNWVGTRNPPGPNLMTNAFLQEIFGMLGIIAPYATELSVPLAPGMPSGPHTLLAGTWSAMETIQNEILSKRDPRVEIGSCYLGLDPKDIFAIIGPLRASKQLLVGIPHAWCDSSMEIGASRILRLESTGWLSAVDTGKIKLDDALQFMAGADWVANFNPTLTTCNLDIANPQLRTLVAAIAKKHYPGLAVSANTVNLALAAEMAQTQGRNTAFDPDDHLTLPISFMGADYCVTGQAWGMGHTKIRFSPGVMAMLAQRGTKPTAEEFIHWVIDGEARLGGAAFFQPDKDKFPTITPKRTKIDGRRPVFADIYAALSAEQTKSYLGDFIKTMANLGERAFDIINQ